LAHGNRGEHRAPTVAFLPIPFHLDSEAWSQSVMKPPPLPVLGDGERDAVRATTRIFILNARSLMQAAGEYPSAANFRLQGMISQDARPKGETVDTDEGGNRSCSEIANRPS